LGNFLHIA
jgi:hypothetical protein